MGESPYRAMPLPAGPPRRWRPIIERGLGVTFNAVLLAAFLALPVAGPHEVHGFAQWLDRVEWDLVLIPLLGLVGFLVRRPRLRACLLFLNALSLFGLVHEVSKSLTIFHRSMLPTLTVVCYVASALTAWSWVLGVARIAARRSLQ